MFDLKDIPEEIIQEIRDTFGEVNTNKYGHIDTDTRSYKTKYYETIHDNENSERFMMFTVRGNITESGFCVRKVAQSGILTTRSDLP